MVRPLLVVAFALIAACGAQTARAQAFTPCADADSFPALAGSQCVTTPTPLEHGGGDDPQSLDLFVRKFPARGEAKGEVWLIAGGPGESGAAFYPLLETFRRAFPGYDLVVPDHRGTGYSSRICPAEEARSSEDAFALGGTEWGPCIGFTFSNPNRTHAFSVTNAAHDLSGLIGRYRGGGEVHVYAVSYGTQLVLRMMQVAPPALDSLILDGLVPPDGDPRWDLSRRTLVVDGIGRAYLGPEGVAAYERLLLMAPTAAWRDRIPGGDLKPFMGSLLDFPSMRGRMPTLVEELTVGDTTTLDGILADLETVSGTLDHYPQSASSLPLVMLISGSENNLRPELTPETVAAESEAALFTSPLAGFLAGNPLPLYTPDTHRSRSPASLPPTLVVQGTLDPKTPYAGAMAHVAALAGIGPVRLAAVEGAPHFVAFVAPDCFVRFASAFVLRGEAATWCREGD